MQWDVFCQVIDNYGDAGVCWRLANNLAQRGQRVRLWIDDPTPLRWMAPPLAPDAQLTSDLTNHAIEILPWQDAEAVDSPILHDDFTPPAVLIEAFGCEIPNAYVQALAAMAHPTKEEAAQAALPAVSSAPSASWPQWLNLEYLSAEAYVERMHLLRSPIMFGPAKGQAKTFFYPGFTPKTGGLLREPELLTQQALFDRAQWRAQCMQAYGPAQPLAPTQTDSTLPASDAVWISLFAYEPDCLPDWLTQWAMGDTPVVLVALAGRSQTWLRECWRRLGWAMPEEEGSCMWVHGGLTVYLLPHVSQAAFDEVLWACDCNLVRGEDSLVRALWAGQAFLWQIYPQEDNAHHAKLHAFLDWLGAPADWRTCMNTLNAIESAAFEGQGAHDHHAPAFTWPSREALRQWQAHAQAARDLLSQRDDLATALITHVQHAAKA